jgi:hypothetical protein
MITTDILGQVIAKPVDPTPLERPQYVTIISIHKEDADKVLEIIADTLRKCGYSNVHSDIKEQKLEAEKHDFQDARNYCKVLLWLERDFQEPEKFIKVFLQCGRYEFMIAGTSGSYRVVMTESMEEQYFGKLRNSIESISKIN